MSTSLLACAWRVKKKANLEVGLTVAELSVAVSAKQIALAKYQCRLATLRALAWLAWGDLAEAFNFHDIIVIGFHGSPL